jgi:hypothetical protein
MATTAFCTSAKVELLQAAHCFNGTTTQTASGVNGAFTLTGLASTAGIAVGAAASGTNVAAGAVVASVDSASQVTLSKAHTGTITTQTITFTHDVFKFALVKASPTRTFDGTQSNIGTPGSGAPSATNLGTDEVAASGGYSAGGATLTNTTPSNPSGTTAITTFNNPQYTSATISTTAAIIYNSSTRLGGAAAPLNGRTVSVHDFGGTQTVTFGTITFNMPTADASSAILRLV